MIPSISDASSAEARAHPDGLVLAGQIDCRKLVINSDSMEAISIMCDGGNSVGLAAAIFFAKTQKPCVSMH
jgi:TPP-dependent indolepyruvate ferredoxin oxidoreductase alpha subunit